MALRTVAFCNGKEIGIDYIYSIIDGKKINDPEKLREIRIKSRNNQLSCPHCGAILELVAGPKKEQHFRLKDSSMESGCKYGLEEKTSIEAKMILKGWMQKSLCANNIESRVPISTISSSERKYEYTFLDRSKSLAVEYDYRCADTSEEKIEVISSNSVGLTALYITDICNMGTEYQYPERQMLIQEKQGFCLFLDSSVIGFPQMVVVYYSQDAVGKWKENLVKRGSLYDYCIDKSGCISFKGENVEASVIKLREEIKEALEKEEKKYRDKLQKQNELQNITLVGSGDLYKNDLTENLGYMSGTSNNTIETSKRLIECEYCGKIGYESEFVSWTGFGDFVKGKCRDCSENNPAAKVVMPPKAFVKKQEYDPMKCPRCGGRLKEKVGKYGAFIGCSNYPDCRYTYNMKKMD